MVGIWARSKERYSDRFQGDKNVALRESIMVAKIFHGNQELFDKAKRAGDIVSWVVWCVYVSARNS